MFPLAVNLNSCAPNAWRMQKNSEVAGFVASFCAPLVLFVLGAIGYSKVCKSVIRWVAVNMVNFAIRPFAKRIEPRKPMRVSFFAKHKNSDGASFAFVANGAKFCGIACFA